MVASPKIMPEGTERGTPAKDAVYFDGHPNAVIVNGKKIFSCTICGECCHIRDPRSVLFTAEEEAAYMQHMLQEFGILYLAPLRDITINVWPEEADTLRKCAAEQGVTLVLKPKRAAFNKTTNEFIILDYYIDHDICPFFKKDRTCSVYGDRPLICRAFPLLSTKTTGNCKYKLADTREYGSEKEYAERLERRVQEQKRVLLSLKANGDLFIPEFLTELELGQIMHNAKLVELRIP